MDLHRLEYIVAIAEYGNITRAAESLHVSQPTLSTYLSDLEKELGVTLFHRERKTLDITPAGEKYVRACREILDIRDRLYRDIYDEKNVTLRVGTQYSSEQVFSLAIRNYKQIYPDVVLKPRIQGSMDCCQQVTKGQLDIGYATCLSDEMKKLYPLITFQEVCRWHYKLLICRSNPVYRRMNTQGNQFHKEDAPLLSEIPLYLFDVQKNEIENKILPRYDIHPHKMVNIGTEASHFITTYILLENGYTFLPECRVSDEFAMLDLPGGPYLQKMLLFPKGHRLTRYEAAFNRIMKEAYQKYPYYYDYSYIDS